MDLVRDLTFRIRCQVVSIANTQVHWKIRALSIAILENTIKHQVWYAVSDPILVEVDGDLSFPGENS